MEEALPRVVAQAASVLDGVKERGRKEGDVMDTTTEEGLRPQVRPQYLESTRLELATDVRSLVCLRCHHLFCFCCLLYP